MLERQNGRTRKKEKNPNVHGLYFIALFCLFIPDPSSRDAWNEIIRLYVLSITDICPHLPVWNPPESNSCCEPVATFDGLCDKVHRLISLCVLSFPFPSATSGKSESHFIFKPQIKVTQEERGRFSSLSGWGVVEHKMNSNSNTD